MCWKKAFLKWQSQLAAASSEALALQTSVQLWQFQDAKASFRLPDLLLTMGKLQLWLY